MKRKSEDAKKGKVSWTSEEDEALLKAVQDDQNGRDADAEEDEDWDDIAKELPGKTPVQCLKRYMAIIQKKESKSSSPTPKEEGDGEYEGENADEEEDGDSDNNSAKKQKTVAKDNEDSGKWTTDEIELLKKLVEHYKDSKISRVLFPFVDPEQSSYNFLLQPHHVGMKSRPTLRTKQPLIVSPIGRRSQIHQ